LFSQQIHCAVRSSLFPYTTLFRSEWGHRREVAEFWIGELDDPADAAILCLETDQVGVGGSKVEPILVHTQTAIANMVAFGRTLRSEEHTSELQSRENLVCRLLLEK